MSFLGLDIGTSGCKAVVYALDGSVLHQAGAPYAEQGGDGRRELEPGLVLAKVREVLRFVGAACGAEVEGLAISSLGESIVCLGAKDEILAPAMVTGDCRGVAETEVLIERWGKGAIFEKTGLPPNALYGLPKWIWLNENSEVVARSKMIFFFEDFIGYYLTGERRVSYTSAARSMAFDIRGKRWDEALLAEAGIDVKQMSRPIEPCAVLGRILPEVAAELGLNPKLLVVAGGHDQSCAALGSGLLDERSMECGMGTCEFTFFMMQPPKDPERMIEGDFPLSPYVVRERYLSSIEVTTCGILKNWLRKGVLQGIDERCRRAGEDFYAHMDALLEGTATNLLMLPQFGSSGNPRLSMDALGTISGLSVHSRVEEFYLAALEGIAFQAYLAYERLRPFQLRHEHIVCTGGGARSPLTLQLRADLFGMEVKTLRNPESGTLGCMLMAATGVGRFSDLKEAVRSAVRYGKSYFPRQSSQAYYREKFERFRSLYAKMHDFR